MDLSVAVAGWSNQADTFLSLLHVYKTKEMFCDCIIASHDKFFHAHKIVLSMCSKLFEKILLSTQDKTPVIILHEIETWQLESLLNFMYKGETQVSDDNFPALLKVAKYLQIKGFDEVERLRNLSVKRLKRQSYLLSPLEEQNQPLNMSLPSKKKSTTEGSVDNKQSSSTNICNWTKESKNNRNISPPTSKQPTCHEQNTRRIKQSTSHMSNKPPEAQRPLGPAITTASPVNKCYSSKEPCGRLSNMYPSLPTPDAHYLSPHYLYPPGTPPGFEQRNFPFPLSPHLSPDQHHQTFHFLHHSNQNRFRQISQLSSDSQNIRNLKHKKIARTEKLKPKDQNIELDATSRHEKESSSEKEQEGVVALHECKTEPSDQDSRSEDYGVGPLSEEPSTVVYSLNNNQYPTSSKATLRKPPPLLKIVSNSFCQTATNQKNEDEIKGTSPKKPEFKITDPLLEKIPTNKRKRVRGPKSWEFLLRLLKSPTSNPSLIKWEDEAVGIFRLIRPEVIAQRWGRRTGKHNHDVLSYESFSRGLRYHYATGALCAVSEKSFVYQFGQKAYKSAATVLTGHLRTPSTVIEPQTTILQSTIEITKSSPPLENDVD